MRIWIHQLCGQSAEFPADVNPNEQQPPCPNCGVAIGGWRRA